MENTKQFGRALTPTWRKPHNLDQLVKLRHAELQHRFAMAVKQRIRGVWTQPELAERCQFEKTRLNEVLNGRSWLGLDDSLRIEQIIGPVMGDMKFDRVYIEDSTLRRQYPWAITGEPPTRGRPRGG